MPPHLLFQVGNERLCPHAPAPGSHTATSAPGSSSRLYLERLPSPTRLQCCSPVTASLTCHLFRESSQLPPLSPCPPAPWGRQQAPFLPSFLRQCSQSTGLPPVWWHRAVSWGAGLFLHCLSVLPGQEPQQEQELCLTRPSCPREPRKVPGIRQTLSRCPWNGIRTVQNMRRRNRGANWAASGPERKLAEPRAGPPREGGLCTCVCPLGLLHPSAHHLGVALLFWVRPRMCAGKATA